MKIIAEYDSENGSQGQLFRFVNLYEKPKNSISLISI